MKPARSLLRVCSEEIARSVRPAPHDPPEGDSARRYGESLSRGAPDRELAGRVSPFPVRAVMHEAASSRPALLRDRRFVEERVTLLEHCSARHVRKKKRAKG